MSSKKTTTQTQTNTLDPQYSSLVYGNAQQAQNLASSYQPYTGQLTADFNPTQLAAQRGLLNYADSGAGSALLGQATDAATTAAGYQPMMIDPQTLAGTDLSQYMNPYQQDVIDASLGDIQRQRDIALNQQKAQSLKAGAWGGTGGAVLQGQLSDNYDRAAATTAANLRSQGYTNAQQAAQFDIGNNFNAQQANQGAGLTANSQHMQASQLLSGLSDQQRAQLLQDLGVKSAVGDAQQQQTQAGLTSEYQRYVDELNQRLALQQGANQGVAIVPQTGTTTGTTVSKSSGLGNIVSGVASLGMAASGIGGLGGLTGGLGSILGATKGYTGILGGDPSQYGY